jgi:hypothetical protein
MKEMKRWIQHELYLASYYDLLYIKEVLALAFGWTGQGKFQR